MRYIAYAGSGFLVPFIPWLTIAVLTGDTWIMDYAWLCGAIGAVIAPFGAYINRNGTYY